MFTIKLILFFLFWLLLIFGFFLLVDFLIGKLRIAKRTRLIFSIVLSASFTLGIVYYIGASFSTRHSITSAPDKTLDTAKSRAIPKSAIHDIIGMTKDGVIRTLGIPIDILSTSGIDNSEEWRYKSGEHTAVEVYFSDGKVKQVFDSVLFK